MSLLAGETYMRGFVIYTDGSLVVTTSTVGATNQQGFLRDADGRLVVQDG